MIGDAGERGMHDDGPELRVDACPQHAGNMVPIDGGRHAGTAELEYNPGLTIFQHGSERTCDFNPRRSRAWSNETVRPAAQRSRVG